MKPEAPPLFSVESMSQGDQAVPNLGKLIYESQREKISTEDLQEAYAEIKQLIAEHTDFRVVYGTIEGNCGRIKLTLEHK